MKILFYLRIVVMGGAERYLLTLLPEFKKRNIDVGFFCTEQDNNKEIIAYFRDHFEQYNIPVYVCTSSSTVSFKAAKSLANIINKEKYTILSVHLMHAEIVSVISKMFLKNHCKLVITKHGYLQQFMDVHGFDHTKLNKWGLSYQVTKFIQHFVTTNFAVSKGLADFFILAKLAKPSKMKVIYHGLDLDFSKNATGVIRHSENQVLVVGRLQRFKGHHLLIEAIKIVAEEIPNMKLVILGKGEEMDNLVNMVNDHKLNEQVFFAGYSDTVCDYILGSDIVVAPSVAEPFGLVVLEAYSCSKPVIAFDVTAFNENIKDNETGCLVTPYNVEEFAQKIKYLLQNKNATVKFGIQGKKLLSDKFSLNESILTTINFFNML